MSGDHLHERIRDQFSDQSTRADIWTIFNTVLNTQEFLNLGYSRWYHPHFLGSSQRRLAQQIGGDLTAYLPAIGGGPLVDVGCGRGGPTIYLADALGVDVTGIDLVSHNIAIAQENAAKRGIPAAFLVGDATNLPVESNSFHVGTALDSIVYVPEKQAAFAEIARVLHADGVMAISDLVVREGFDDPAPTAVTNFAEKWDMPPLIPLSQYRQAIERAGLTVLDIQDISSQSIAHLRKWTTLSLRLISAGSSDPVAWLLTRWGLDPTTITAQVRYAHMALPHLQHVIIYARNGEEGHLSGDAFL